MSKGLEAFKKIKTFCVSDDWDRLVYLKDRYSEELSIIETELKRLELFENHSIFTINDVINENKELKEILRIIKEKNVDVAWLLKSENCSKYNLGVGSKQALKKPQYNLLREAFKDE